MQYVAGMFCVQLGVNIFSNDPDTKANRYGAIPTDVK